MKSLLVLVLTMATFTGAVSTYSVRVDHGGDQTAIPLEDSGMDEKNQTEITLVTFQAIINFIHIDLHFTSYLIQELTPVSDIVHFRDFAEPVYNSGYFTTLFRFIISPNAP